MVTLRFVPQWGVQGDASKICGNVEVPPGYTVKVQHKFIVLEDGSVGDGIATSFLLVIGPVYGGYYHKNIWADVDPDERLKISGGGYVEFSGAKRDGKMKWVAKFYDGSGDFGVFDPRILSASSRKEIADTLRMFVTFEWVGSTQPSTR